MQSGTARNAPCPCGSGRKYKNCCLHPHRPPPTAPAGRAGLPAWVGWCVLGLSAGLTVWVRLRLLNLPLERDEGEYAYFGQLLLDGVPPYLKAYNMKPPGTAAMYALIMAVFGQSAGAIHLGLLLINLANGVLLFLILRRLLATGPGAAAGTATYLLIALSPAVLGFAGHATHFIVLFVLAGTYLLLLALAAQRTWMYLAAGFFLGTAILMKTHAVFYCLFAGAVVLSRAVAERGRGYRFWLLRLFCLAGGATVPLLLAGASLWLCGVFDRFWFWTVRYAAVYGTSGFAGSWRAFKVEFLWVSNGFRPLWLLAGAGILILILDKTYAAWRAFVLLFLGASVAALLPGFHFRNHYFVVLLPSLATAVAIAVDMLSRALSTRPRAAAAPWMPLILWLACMGSAAWQHRGYLFAESPEHICRRIYLGNPFAESARVAEFLRANTQPGDTIAVLGSEPQLYFYARRRAATGFIYTYALMEAHQYALTMQEQMIREIESADPAMLVFVSVPVSWLRKPQSHDRIFRWFDEYRKRYELVGIVDLIPGQGAVFKWDGDARQYQSRSPMSLWLYKRRVPAAAGG